MKSLRDIVEKLRKEGHSVTYIKREGGSIVVTSIDSERFHIRTRAGNKKARVLAGEELSERLLSERKSAGRKAARATNIKKARKPRKPHKKTKAELKEEREYQRLRRQAKKKGLKAIGKRQIKAAKKRGKTWKQIKEDIIQTYKARYSKIAHANTVEGLIIFLEQWNLGPDLIQLLKDGLANNTPFLSKDIQDCRDAAYDAVYGDGEFNETYWIDRLSKGSEKAKGEFEDLAQFEKDLRGKK